MNKRLKFFLSGLLEANEASSNFCKEKGEIILSVRKKQVEKYKEINNRQVRERRELVSSYQ